jgi:glutathione peroxidase-family protein
MSTILQFGKSLFSARHTSVSDAATKPSFYERQFTNIKGQPLDMDQLRGKVILLVNTASECGYTPQLYTLQELQTKYQDRGFTVLVCICFSLFTSFGY